MKTLEVIDETLATPKNKFLETSIHENIIMASLVGNETVGVPLELENVKHWLWRSLSLLFLSDQIIMNEVDKLGDGFGRRHMNHGGGDQKRLL